MRDEGSNEQLAEKLPTTFFHDVIITGQLSNAAKNFISKTIINCAILRFVGSLNERSTRKRRKAGTGK